MGDTATSVNQGGASGSTGLQLGGKQMRMAAAEARRVLVEMAAAKLGAPADQLIVVDGIVSAAFNRDKKTSYAELIGGKYFNVQLDWNKQMGNALYAPGKAQAEAVQGPQDRRQADQARRRRAQGVRPGRLRARHQSAGHGSRPDDPSGSRGRGAGQGRRKLDQGHSWRPGGSSERIHRRGRPQGMGRHPGHARSSRSSGRRSSRRSRTRPRSTITSARRRCASRRSKARPPATSMRRSRPPPR